MHQKSPSSGKNWKKFFTGFGASNRPRACGARPWPPPPFTNRGSATESLHEKLAQLYPWIWDPLHVNFCSQSTYYQYQYHHYYCSCNTAIYVVFPNFLPSFN